MHKVFRPRSYKFIESHWTEHQKLTLDIEITL